MEHDGSAMIRDGMWFAERVEWEVGNNELASGKRLPAVDRSFTPGQSADNERCRWARRQGSSVRA
jgi:hypothetical protein